MTLQIAMSGQDGWVLASDRRRLDVGDAASVRTASTMKKIVVENRLRIAYAVAGADEIGSIVGREMLAALAKGKMAIAEPHRFAEDLRLLANKMWRRVYRNLKQAYPIDPSHTARGMIVCFASWPSFLSLGIGRDSVPQWLRGMAVFGDVNNPAKFFPARYYSGTLSTEQLTFLAAHTITVGSKLAPTGVGGGLDIALCENDSIRLLSEQETTELEAHSLKLDTKLGDLLKGAS